VANVLPNVGTTRNSNRTGKLVARYESFVDLDPVMGTARCGWYRYDADGFLSSWDEDVPELLAFAAPELSTIGPSDGGWGLLAKEPKVAIARSANGCRS
jgi:hypothetical protein